MSLRETFDPEGAVAEARERAAWLDVHSAPGSRGEKDAHCFRGLAYMIEALGALIVAHHAAGTLDGSLVGDKCPVCMMMFSDGTDDPG